MMMMMMMMMSQTHHNWKKTNTDDDKADDDDDESRRAPLTTTTISSSSPTAVPAALDTTSLATWWKRTPAWRTVRGYWARDPWSGKMVWHTHTTTTTTTTSDDRGGGSAPAASPSLQATTAVSSSNTRPTDTSAPQTSVDVTKVFLRFFYSCHVFLRFGGFFVLVKAVVRLQRILSPKMPFSFVKKCKFRPKLCHRSRISPVFRHPKMRPFQQCITVTAVTLFYEVLPKQFEAFGFYFSQEKKTGEC